MVSKGGKNGDFARAVLLQSEGGKRQAKSIYESKGRRSMKEDEASFVHTIRQVATKDFPFTVPLGGGAFFFPKALS